MQPNRLKQGAVLLAAVIVAWVGVLVPPVFAQRAPVPQTGQTQCWETDLTTLTSTLIPCAGTGQDGEIQAGVPLPTPRFVDNGNGTVTDRLTGLIWLQQANCFGAVQWPQALAAVKTVARGSCGLMDRSQAGDWRLPNARELHSLIDFGFFSPALSNAAGTDRWKEDDPFSGVQVAGYWSSTTAMSDPSVAFSIYLGSGNIFAGVKRDYPFVWPVRGGR